MSVEYLHFTLYHGIVILMYTCMYLAFYRIMHGYMHHGHMELIA